MKELELEERRVKLEEDKLKFEREKWLQQQQQKTGQQGQANRQYEVQIMDSTPAHQTLQPVPFFANDDRQQDTIGLDEHVLDPSEY